MPPEERTAAPAATAHVAHYEVPYERRIERREVVMRAGNWIRGDRTTERYTIVHHSHMGSATSFSYSRDAGGRIEAIRVARDAAARPYHRMHRAATGRRGRRLGEPCWVWKITDVEPLTPSEWLSCETRDGIQLWVREQSREGGDLFEERRATRIRRRPVPPDEARPPADFFALASLPDGPAWSAPGPDFRVVLESASVSGGRPGRQIVQRRGAFRSHDSQDEDGGRRLALGHGTFNISYEEEPDGRPLRLYVGRMPDHDIVVIGGDWIPIEGREPETILGETCRWMRGTIIVSHYRRVECRTGDGIVLQSDEQSMAGHTVYRATSLSRRPLTPGDFRLPDRALNLSGWSATAD